jgi:hypothetical protein
MPQLSSKRPRLVAEGITWNNAETLREYLQLRLTYPQVRLLWSGDWSTFSAPDFWVTIAGVTFPNADGALGWCRAHNLDRDHRYAKLVSTAFKAMNQTPSAASPRRQQQPAIGEHSAHPRHRIERRHEVHLRGARVGEADIHAAADQRADKGLCTIHRIRFQLLSGKGCAVTATDVDDEDRFVE